MPHDNNGDISRNVETLVRDVNSHMRQRQEQERLKTIIARIDSYEPIETKDEELQVIITITTTIIVIIIIDSYEPIETKDEELQVNGDPFQKSIYRNKSLAKVISFRNNAIFRAF